MPRHVLFDTGTLRNFAACDALGVLQQICHACDGPFWVEAVHAEVSRLSVERQGRERTQCRYILSGTHGAWLGDPIDSAIDDLSHIFAIRTALASGLGGHPREHLGEAQSIWVAEQSGATFATDDGPAFEYAVRRLATGRVVDTVQLLRNGVAHGSFSAERACEVAGRMRDAGRNLRPGHPTLLRPDDFT